jgi:hypothetical protein
MVTPPISASALLPPLPPSLPLPLPGSSNGPSSNPFAFDTISHANPDEHRQESQPTQHDINADATRSGVCDATKASQSHTAIERSTNHVKWQRLRYFLVLYAIVMTVLAGYGWFFRTPAPAPAIHPLSTIPDSFGEFDPANRKKVSQLNVDFDAPLPPALRTGLGQVIEIGQLQVLPTRVEKRRLQIVTERRQGVGTYKHSTTFEAIVLHLQITNTSADIPIYPLDPAFTRSATSKDKPATRLSIGKSVLYGGAIAWPFANGTKRQYEEAQASDYEPLNPGATREYVVFTNEDAELARVLQTTTEALLWRVQLRRGTVDWKGKEVPVSAVIGVDLTANQIETSN